MHVAATVCSVVWSMKNFIGIKKAWRRNARNFIVIKREVSDEVLDAFNQILLSNARHWNSMSMKELVNLVARF